MVEIVSILIHRGHLIQFHLQHIVSSEEAETKLTANLFKYSPYIKSFEKVSVSEKALLHKTLPGNWTFVTCNKIFCELSGTVQPCILFRKQAASEKDALSITLYQLTDLKVLNGVTAAIPDKSRQFWKDESVFIVGGPALICFNLSAQKLIYLNINTQHIKSLSLAQNFAKIFLLKQQYNYSQTNITFLGVEKCCTPKNAGKCTVFVVTVARCHSKNVQVSINYRDPKVPSVYSSLIIAASTWETTPGSSLLMISNRNQLLCLRDGDIAGVCDIPLEHCDVIESVGKEEMAVAILLDRKATKSCAISLKKFEVLKVWNNAAHVTMGNFAHSGDVVENIFVLFSNDMFQMITPNGFALIPSAEDVLCQDNSTVEAFPLQSTVDHSCDMDYDLFSSPPDGEKMEERSEEALGKVISTLEKNVNKHKAAIDRLRYSLQQKYQVISVTRKALYKMNHNVHLVAQQKETLHLEDDDDMIDLFSSESCHNKAQITEDVEYVILQKTWQCVMYDQLVFGFELTNVSDKVLSKIAVILTPPSEIDSGNISAANRTVHSKMMRKASLNDWKTNQQIDRTSDFGCDHLLETVKPKEEFILVARMAIPIFSAGDSSPCSYRAAFTATLSDLGEKSKISEKEPESCYVFHAGQLNVTASNMVTHSSVVNANNLLEGISTEEIFQKVIPAIKSCHDHQSRLLLSSNSYDLVECCKVIFQSIGFVYHESVGFYFCNRVGPLYLSIIKSVPSPNRYLNLYLSCRSSQEEGLIVSYIHEQIPNDLFVQTKNTLLLDEQVLFE
ncbi:unnamed protein product [Clavelina lepadiformis]|uniref:Fanconi anemia group B protein n=1 Tax=Clavelina lepadiformis TaxID=159417 RepID=A0ABP0FXK3_CLALP